MARFRYKKRIATGLDTHQRILTIQETIEPTSDPLTIIATLSGVKVMGNMEGEIETPEDMTSFGTAMASAFMDHQRLKTDMQKRLLGKKK